MSAPDSLKDVYLDEMQDLWSANDQMVKATSQLTGQASDAKLKQMLEHALGGIQKHTDVLKGLIQANGGETKPEHCKGMEGLVAEALKHGIKEAPSDGKLRDVQIIAQYQRMSHYGARGLRLGGRLRQGARTDRRRGQAQAGGGRDLQGRRGGEPARRVRREGGGLRRRAHPSNPRAHAR